MTSEPKSALRPLALRALEIITDIRVHDEFARHPRTFAAKQGVYVHGRPVSYTDLANNGTAQPGEGVVTTSVNLAHGGVSLFMPQGKEGDRIRNIKINPGLALYGDSKQLVDTTQLDALVKLIRRLVAPLLADARDSRHIVPSPLQGDEEHVAYWNMVEIEQVFPDVDLGLVSGLRHQDATIGSAKGSTHRFARLGDKKDGLQIEFRKVARLPRGASTGDPKLPHLLVRLQLGEACLAQAFECKWASVRIKETPRVVTLRAADLITVYREQLAEVEGTYLPVPLDWVTGATIESTARVVALLAATTPLTLAELLEMESTTRPSSTSTRQRLRKTARREYENLGTCALTQILAPP
jgi:hypothetical protein